MCRIISIIPIESEPHLKMILMYTYMLHDTSFSFYIYNPLLHTYQVICLSRTCVTTDILKSQENMQTGYDIKLISTKLKWLMLMTLTLWYIGFYRVQLSIIMMCNMSVVFQETHLFESKWSQSKNHDQYMYIQKLCQPQHTVKRGWSDHDVTAIIYFFI